MSETLELTSLAALMSEKEVYDKYPHIFADKELREARQRGELEFFALRKGVFYTEDQLLAYLNQRRQKPCANRPLLVQESDNPPASGNSKTNGSGAKPVRLITTDAGTQETDGLIARALERQT
jgi:hypothetical protein